MRRLNRTVNKEDSVYPQLLSKSPLIDTTRPTNVQRKEKIVRGVLTSKFSCPPSADIVSALRTIAENSVPKAPAVDQTARLGSALMKRILHFVGDTPLDLVAINAVCRAWRQASLSLIDEIVVIPHLIAFDADSNELSRKVRSLSSFLSVNTRGQHLRRLTLVDTRQSYSLPQTVKGTTMTVPQIHHLISQTPNLSHLDIRGINLPDFAPVSDKFFVSLHLLTPCLRSLKTGAMFLRNWSPQWWARLPYLSEFVIGSRREDADWDDGTPVQIHDDVFGMLRSPAHVWSTVKLWVPLTHQAFVSLVIPSAPYPRVANLTVNAAGNCSMKPLEEGIQDAPKDEKKKTEKSTRKGVQADDSTSHRGAFPALVSLTIADVTERPDFSVELMARMTQQAPHLKHFNVVNTLRTAPTHIEPPAAKGRKLRRM